MRSLSLILVSLVAGAWALVAQDTPIHAGDRVRLRAAPFTPRFVGTLASYDADSLVLTAVKPRVVPGQAMRIPLSAVSEITVSRGRRAHTLLGMGVGGVAGLVLGGGLMLVACDDSGPFRPSESVCGDLTLVFAGIGAGVGLAVGALAGTAIRTDRWESVPIERIRVGIRTGRTRAVALAGSVQF